MKRYMIHEQSIQGDAHSNWLAVGGPHKEAQPALDEALALRREYEKDADAGRLKGRRRIRVSLMEVLATYEVG